MPDIYMEHEGKMIPLTDAKIGLSIKDSEPMLKLKDMERSITLTAESINVLTATMENVVMSILDFISAFSRTGLARRKMKSMVKQMYGKSFRSARKAAAYYERLKGRGKLLKGKMSNYHTETFLVKAIVDSNFGPFAVKIEFESKDGKSVVMGCKKSVFREEYIGKRVRIEYWNPFEFGVFYQILTMEVLEEA